MTKRYGRHALNGTTRYYDNYEELCAEQQQENQGIRAVLFGIAGLIAGGILTYMLLQRMHVDSRIIRFAGVMAGVWFGCILAAALSELLWTILKWTLALTAIIVIGGFIYFAV